MRATGRASPVRTARAATSSKANRARPARQAGQQQPGQGLGEQQRRYARSWRSCGRAWTRSAPTPRSCGTPRESMKNAEQGLQQGDTSSALGDQSQALEQMRQGAQKMAEDAQKNGQSRYGQNGDTPRDPLGRPQRFQGPDAGNSVKVPDEIDMQRAREILEELRRRVAQPARPADGARLLRAPAAPLLIAARFGASRHLSRRERSAGRPNARQPRVSASSP